MEKLVLEKNLDDYYILEVNDKGDTIEFDLTDIRLPQLIMEAGDNMEKLGNEYAKKEKEILESSKTEEEKVRELFEIENEHSKELRKLFDSFLGEGACYKIFGNKESFGQYNKLMEALEPHFKKMKFKRYKAQERLANKYIEKKSDVI